MHEGEGWPGLLVSVDFLFQWTLCIESEKLSQGTQRNISKKEGVATIALKAAVDVDFGSSIHGLECEVQKRSKYFDCSLFFHDLVVSWKDSKTNL